MPSCSWKMPTSSSSQCAEKVGQSQLWKSPRFRCFSRVLKADSKLHVKTCFVLASVRGKMDVKSATSDTESSASYRDDLPMQVELNREEAYSRRQSPLWINWSLLIVYTDDQHYGQANKPVRNRMLAMKLQFQVKRTKMIVVLYISVALCRGLLMCSVECRLPLSAMCPTGFRPKDCRSLSEKQA